MPDETPSTQPTTPKLSDRIITVLGLCIFVAGLITARVLRSAEDAELGQDVGDLLKSFGAVIAAVGGALPVPELLRRIAGAGGAKLLMALVMGGALTAGSLLSGCASTRSGERLDIVLHDHPTAPAPACHYRVELDGELVVEGDVDICPSVPVCSEVEP